MYSDVYVVYLGTSNAPLCVTDPQQFHLYYVYFYNDIFSITGVLCIPCRQKGLVKRD